MCLIKLSQSSYNVIALKFKLFTLFFHQMLLLHWFFPINATYTTTATIWGLNIWDLVFSLAFVEQIYIHAVHYVQNEQ